MGLIPRTFKIKKGCIGLFLTTLVFIYLLTSLPSTSIHQQLTLMTSSSSSSSSLSLNKKPLGQAFNRLSTSHQQLLNSASTHIRLGYVANKTPHYSTPPLLILYSYHHQHENKKKLDQRLVDITNAYFFSMMQPGSAFAYDMTWPIKFEWFFSSSPGYMTMTTDQASYYKDRIQPHEIQYQVNPIQHLVTKDFFNEYTKSGIQIVSTTHWQPQAWLQMAQNPFLKPLRDKYRLNHLVQTSDWFWLASRLLFSRGSPWLNQQLEPYKDIMGGKLEYSESASFWNPHTAKISPDFAATKHWLRIGLRVKDEHAVACLVAHVATVCDMASATTAGSCHVFLSAPNRSLLKFTRKYMSTFPMAVHAVAEGYGFADLDEQSENSLDHSIFDTDEERLKRDYARTFMDWIILSRMDYLVGHEHDGFLNTAAWAAQVQTDVIQSVDECHIMPMSDW